MGLQGQRLMAAGVVKLKQVAQDGMRVRASAGAGSFRRKEKLEGYLEAARTEVARLKAELEALKEVATARMTRIRDTEILLQKIRTAIKSDGRPGMSLSQDHFRLKSQLDAVRKLLNVTGEG